MWRLITLALKIIIPVLVQMMDSLPGARQMMANPQLMSQMMSQMAQNPGMLSQMEAMVRKGAWGGRMGRPHEEAAWAQGEARCYP